MKLTLRISSFAVVTTICLSLSTFAGIVNDPESPSPKDFEAEFRSLGVKFATYFEVFQKDNTRESKSTLMEVYFDYFRVREYLRAALEHRLNYTILRGHAGAFRDLGLANFIRTRFPGELPVSPSIEDLQNLNAHEESSFRKLKPKILRQHRLLNSGIFLVAAFYFGGFTDIGYRMFFQAPPLSLDLWPRVVLEFGIPLVAISAAFQLGYRPSRDYISHGKIAALELQKFAHSEMEFWRALQASGLALPSHFKNGLEKEAYLKGALGEPLSPKFYSIEEVKSLQASSAPKTFEQHLAQFSRRSFAPDSIKNLRPRYDLRPAVDTQKPKWPERRLIQNLHTLSHESGFDNTPLGNYLNNRSEPIYVSVSATSFGNDESLYIVHMGPKDNSAGPHVRFIFAGAFDSAHPKVFETQALTNFLAAAYGHNIPRCSFEIMALNNRGEKNETHK